MRRTTFLAIASMILLGLGGLSAHAQANATASRAGDLQVGGGMSLADSDYGGDKYKGFFIYSTFDFKEHWGIDFTFHQVKFDNPPGIHLSERTYEIGPRYVLHYGRFNPYAKVMIGRGVFNFPYDAANLAYNMFGGAGGVDVAIIKRVNVRAEYEYQHWMSFPPNGSLSPQVYSVGAAYHF